MHDHLHMENKIKGLMVRCPLVFWSMFEDLKIKPIGSKIALKEVNLDQSMGGHAPQPDKTSIMGLYYTF